MALHWKIVLGLVLGLLFGFGMTFFDFGPAFVSDWVQPFGTIFVRLLKLIAIPLILASLVKGIADLKDISKFKNMGIRTFVTYMITTVVAILIGLSLVNIIQPGIGISDETVAKLTTTYANDSGVTSKIATASAQKDASPLQFIVDMVPDNIFYAMSNNGLMLQVIFFFDLICYIIITYRRKSSPTH
jgi:Na+/H+-dicarboxylate symporter